VSTSHVVPRVKVCGLTRAQDAAMAEAAGAHYLGVILAPGRARSVTPGDARRILGETARTAVRVGVFVDAEADALRDAADTAGLDVLQLHGDEPPELCATMRAAGYGAHPWFGGRFGILAASSRRRR
jgi:phosphoribosylanthranilate isomerase